MVRKSMVPHEYLFTVHLLFVSQTQVYSTEKYYLQSHLLFQFVNNKSLTAFVCMYRISWRYDGEKRKPATQATNSRTRFLTPVLHGVLNDMQAKEPDQIGTVLVKGPAVFQSHKPLQADEPPARR